ncbi:MAG: hypothetical protein U1C56_02545 [Candidatus Curtissbacteria bacterium]|nr:hypothetical protein [Candidatus Curtissbacteria bacterium]
MEETNEEKIGAEFAAASTYDLVKALYKDDKGRPFSITPTQNIIFDCIFKKRGPEGQKRIHVMTFTQFGKSDIVSMAVLTRVAAFGEKWVIIAPSQSKARIIIGYLIKHIFDNEFTLSRFKIGEGESVDTIRRERSKNRLTFDCGAGKIGEVFILSAESRLRSGDEVGNSLMGFGSPNVVMDEAALVSDEADAKAMRMVGGFTGAGEDFVVKIGNPFRRNHFLLAQQDPAYYKINADYHVGIKEKNEYGEARLTEKYIEEMRKKPFFGVQYENKFPNPDDVDLRGWTQLMSEEEIETACRYDETPEHVGEKRLGHDVARAGSDNSTWVKRSMNFCEVLMKAHIVDLTDTAAQTMLHMKTHEIGPENVFVDDVGVGGGEVDHLNYQQKKVRAVNSANTALEQSRFVNVRAEAYWRLREWIKRGGKLCACHKDDWMDMTKIKYKPDSKGRLRIMSKDEMRAMGLESPDVCDGAMLTFARKEHGDLEQRRKAREQKRKIREGNRGLKVSMGGY